MKVLFRILAGAGLAVALTALPACAGEGVKAVAAGDNKPAAGAADSKTAAAGDSKPSGSSSDSKSSSGPKEKCPYTTQDCLNHMASRLKASGWIGIEYEPAEGGTITVQKVVPGSPAEKAGLQPGDLLFSINGVEIRNENNQALMKIDRRPGQTLHYVVKRNGVAKPVDIVLGQWPADLLAKYIGEHMLEHAEADALAQGPPK
ncbi:MAG TPA: PDZ domain-containing protein [Candidatus Polarisedimenticolia bacterium]|jgi:membrane-associated protease RseP (regulator of RpoE activity)|nr:PDZ domain-containing protein [Candidatus Polarisedimenticolia bacterium]